MRTQNALSRSQESAEAHEMRLSIDRERHAKSRASETFTQRETRLSSQRNRTDVARSYEQREERRAAARQRYHELLGDASTHLSQERDRIQEIRGTWSDEQRAAQVEQDRLRRNVNQLSTSDEESTVYDIEEQPWLNKEGSGFMYNVAINYAAYGNIGALEEVCAHCQARKWKGEPNGMCCASGKVRLDSMQDPPDLLWSRVHTLRLTINMRAQLGGNTRAQEFSDVLQSLGDGTLPEERDGQVVLPESLDNLRDALEYPLQ
ncbi:hypothetical protein HF086_004854 [Spodoptera exigua]|uniref:Uncharacterized protein n=1 Tax=Spodoptera exigua TaxID=7107 RepID=A0A922M4T3_SPOEX|nr:hypothetical protein HF086_004854 [Spodoptera exigua]